MTFQLGYEKVSLLDQILKTWKAERDASDTHTSLPELSVNKSAYI